MAFSGNTVPYKTEWIKAYQETHYKQPVFPIFADQKFADVLAAGATIKWSYDADIDAPELGTDGAYSVENRTVTDETLTVDQLPSATFRIPGPQRIQDHRPTQAKWSAKAMNRIFWKMDARMLSTMKTNAASTVDAGDLGGSSGTAITVTSGNAAAIFAAARRKLRNQNVIYDENKKWSGYTKLDAMAKYPAAAIPAELEEQVLLAIGFKPGDLGDQVLTRGYMNMLFGFNTFVSTTLPMTFLFTIASGNLSNGDTLVIAGLTYTFKTGSVTTAGDILIGGSATLTGDNIVTALASPYTDVSTTFKAFNRSTLTVAQRMVADSLAYVAATNASGAVTVTLIGLGSQSVTTTSATGTVSAQAVHAIFGTSQSIALVLQRFPELTVSGDIIGNGSTGGYVARDFVTWTLAGWKCFLTQTKQLVGVSIASSAFSAPNNVYN